MAQHTLLGRACQSQADSDPVFRRPEAPTCDFLAVYHGVSHPIPGTANVSGAERVNKRAFSRIKAGMNDWGICPNARTFGGALPCVNN